VGSLAAVLEIQPNLRIVKIQELGVTNSHYCSFVSSLSYTQYAVSPDQD